MNIITSTSDKPYREFFVEVLNTFEKYNITGIAIVGLTDGENLTGYWRMSLRDKETAKTEIGYDCIDEFIKNNADRYFEVAEKNED